MRKGDSMKFTKMHGIGNCYLYFNCFEDPVLNPEDLSLIHISEPTRRS